MIRICVLFLCCSLLTGIVYATCPSGLPQTDVYYVNGIWTTSQQAEVSRANLGSAFRAYMASRSKLPYLDCVTFILSYNNTQGKLKDILETFGLLSPQYSQYLATSNTTLSQMSDDVKIATILSVQAYAEGLAEHLRQWVDSVGVPTTRPKSQAELDIEALVSRATTSLRSGHKVVLIGHSEGNLFTNAAYDRLVRYQSRYLTGTGIALPNSTRLEVIGVATPASRVGGNPGVSDSRRGHQRYTTHCLDFIQDVPQALTYNTLGISDVGLLNFEMCATHQVLGWISALKHAVEGVLGVDKLAKFFLGQSAGITVKDVQNKGTVATLALGIADSIMSYTTHLFDYAYMNYGSPTREQILRDLEDTLLDPACAGDFNCYLKDTFTSADFSSNWLTTYPNTDFQSMRAQGGVLTLSVTQYSDGSLFGFPLGGNMDARTREVFVGPFEASFQFKFITNILNSSGAAGWGTAVISIKKAADDSTAISLTLSNDTGLAWHTLTISRSDTTISMAADGQCWAGQSASSVPAGPTDGYYIEVKTGGNNDLQVQTVSVLRLGAGTAAPPPVPLPFTVKCSPDHQTVLEGQPVTFQATPTGGKSPFKYAWSGAVGTVSGTFDRIQKTFFIMGTYAAKVVVTDNSSSPQSQTADCSVQVNEPVPPSGSPAILGIALGSTPIAGTEFDLQVSASGLVPASVQVWFFGLNSCQTGCKHPAAGLLNPTPNSLSMTGVRLSEDIYRIKVRNADSGSWSAASDSFQVINSSAPMFGLATLSSSRTVSAGQAVSYDMGLTARNGFAGVVNWQVTGLPAGAAIANGSQQLNVNGAGMSFSIPIQTAPATPVGTYALTAKAVSATNSALFQTLNLSLTITAGPPAVLNAICAVNGQTNALTLQVGSQATYSVTASGGTAPLHYSWTGVTGNDSNAALAIYSAPGTYDVAVVVSDSAASKQQVTASCPRVTVPSPPSFSLLTLGSSKTIQAGQPATFDIHVAAANGFSGVVNWQLTGLPSGVSVTNTSHQVSVTTSGADFTINLQSTATTVTNSYTLTLTGSSGVVTDSIPLYLTVMPAPLSASCVVNGQTTPLTLQVGNQATYIVTASGGTSPLHYTWSGVSGTDSNSALQIYTTAGTYNVSAIVSDSATLKQQATVSCPTVTVVGPSLSLTAISTYSQLKPGDVGGVVQVSATYANIPAGATITMTISGLPTGVTATTPSQVVNGSGSVTLSSSFSLSSAVQPGTYSLTATVSVAFLSQQVFATLQVLTPPSLSVSNCSFSPATIWAGQVTTVSVPAPSGGTPPYIYSWSGAVSGMSQSISSTFPNPGALYTATVLVSDSGAGVNWQTRQVSCSVQTYAASTPPQNPGLTYTPTNPHPGNVVTINLFSSGGFSSNTEVWVFGVACINGCRAALVAGSISSTGTAMQALAQLNNADNFQIKVRNTSSGSFVLAGTVSVF